MRIFSLLLAAVAAFASDARFTDELWIQIEPLHQHAVQTHPRLAAVHENLGPVFMILSAKAPREEWRDMLARAAKEQTSSNQVAPHVSQRALATIEREPFAEGLAAILARIWIAWEISKDTSQEGRLAQFIRMMNSTAENLDAAARKRVKQSFVDSARELYLSFEK